jgi:hypothetical protein
MKRAIVIIVAVAVSFAAGWYFGYTRPVAQNQRKILKEYAAVRDMMGYTDAEMTHAAETFPKPQEVLASMAREDEVVAAMAVASVRLFDRGDPEAAKQRLLHVLGTYYRVHRSNDLYTNIIMRIEKAALESPSIAAEIAKKSE